MPLLLFSLAVAAAIAPQQSIFLPNKRTPGDVLEEKLEKLKGKPAQTAFDKLGFPDRKMSVGGSVVYIWSNSDENLDGGALSCTVKVITRSSRIVDTDFHGNNGACAHYARRLEPGYRF